MRWVSAVRLIELRQDAGAIQAANALPLELDSYETEAGAFEKEAKIFCNYVLGELVEAEKRKDEAYAKQDKAAQTKANTRVILLKNPVAVWLRNTLVPIAMKVPAVRRSIVKVPLP